MTSSSSSMAAGSKWRPSPDSSRNSPSCCRVRAIPAGQDRGMMSVSPAELSNSEADQLRTFERQGHDALARSYHAFFAAVTALATHPLFDAVHLQTGTRLLEVASGPGALAAEAANRGARPVGVDLSPRMIELAQQLHPTIEYREADVEHLPF